MLELYFNLNCIFVSNSRAELMPKKKTFIYDSALIYSNSLLEHSTDFSLTSIVFWLWRMTCSTDGFRDWWVGERDWRLVCDNGLYYSVQNSPLPRHNCHPHCPSVCTSPILADKAINIIDEKEDDLSQSIYIVLSKDG